MNSTTIERALSGLRIATIQYQHEEYLRKRFEEAEQSRFNILDKPRYEEKINYFFSLEKNVKGVQRQINLLKLKSKLNYIDTVKARIFNNEKEITNTARKASIYYQQALEMYQTSINMPETTSPLIEYYALLQCVKGSVLLDLDIKEDVFFRHHGISSIIKENSYINAIIQPVGVFSALTLRFAHYQNQRDEEGETILYKNEMEVYFKEYFIPSLEEIICQPNSFTYELSHNTLPLVFIGSWMLSILVRYNPLIWQDILAGQKNDLIYFIRDFREEEIPKAIESCLPDPIRMKTGRRPSPKKTNK